MTKTIILPKYHIYKYNHACTDDKLVHTEPIQQRDINLDHGRNKKQRI